MKYDFDQVIDRSANRAAKYDERIKKFGTNDVIPLWVADMDFKTAQPIIDALNPKQRRASGDTPHAQTVILTPSAAGSSAAMAGRSTRAL